MPGFEAARMHIDRLERQKFVKLLESAISRGLRIFQWWDIRVRGIGSNFMQTLFANFVNGEAEQMVHCCVNRSLVIATL